MDSYDQIEERILRRMPKEIGLAALVLSIPAALLFGLKAGAFFLMGGAAAAVGFLWLTQVVSRLFLRPDKTSIRKAVLIYALRLVLICALMLAIISISPKSIPAFGAGFSVLVIITFAEGVAALARMKKWKA